MRIRQHSTPPAIVQLSLEMRAQPASLNFGNDERHAHLMQPTAARRVLWRSEDVFVLVSSLVCVRAWLLCITWLENGFVDVVARVHGHNMFDECLPVRPHSLLLHRAVSHSRCCYFPGIWYRIATVWAEWMEMDWRHNNYWRDRAHLRSRTLSWSLSAKRSKLCLTNG